MTSFTAFELDRTFKVKHVYELYFLEHDFAISTCYYIKYYYNIYDNKLNLKIQCISSGKWFLFLGIYCTRRHKIAAQISLKCVAKTFVFFSCLYLLLHVLKIQVFKISFLRKFPKMEKKIRIVLSDFINININIYFYKKIQIIPHRQRNV